MMGTLRGRAAALAATGGVVLTMACDDIYGGPVLDEGRGRIAVVAWDPEPTLWIHDVGGDAERRIHFNGAADPIEGNHPQLPVTDETIRALGPVKWAPDGQRVAIVATVAFDQSEVVIIGADGSGARVASVNTQNILSDVAWSADGTRIAYTMSTLPHATGVDVFLTELASSRVIRLTENYQPGVPGVELAFDATGGAVFVTKMTGEATARLDRIDVATRALTTVATGLPGEPQAIAPGGGFVLLMQRDGADRVLVRYSPSTQTRLELARHPQLQFAELDARGEHALYVIGDDRSEHRVVHVGGGPSTGLTLKRRGSFAVDLYR